jgi:hypothetical protein
LACVPSKDENRDLDSGPTLAKLVRQTILQAARTPRGLKL